MRAKYKAEDKDKHKAEDNSADTISASSAYSVRRKKLSASGSSQESEPERSPTEAEAKPTAAAVSDTSAARTESRCGSRAASRAGFTRDSLSPVPVKTGLTSRRSVDESGQPESSKIRENVVTATTAAKLTPPPATATPEPAQRSCLKVGASPPQTVRDSKPLSSLSPGKLRESPATATKRDIVGGSGVATSAGTSPKLGGGQSSPVTLRHQQKGGQAAADVWKLVDLKQPEPSAFATRPSVAARASDPGLPRGASPRPASKDVWPSPATARTSPRPAELPLSSDNHPVAADSANSSSGGRLVNFGLIDDSVNVKERASMFGSRCRQQQQQRPESLGNSSGPTAAAKLRTVSVGNSSSGVSGAARGAVTEKQRTVSVGSGGLEAKRKGSAAMHPTSPSKIKNMAALFENKA